MESVVENVEDAKKKWLIAAVEMAEYFHVSLDYLLLEETESNRKAKRDSLIMVYFQHPSFGSHSVTGTLG